MPEHEDATPHKVDRTGWPPGPWDGEPDKVLWKAHGLDCMIVRAPLGHLCGYVGVHEGHPWFGVDYDDIHAGAHGGLTYSDYCRGHICHPSPEKTYWIGFDCAHHGDLSPEMSKYRSVLPGEVYRDLAYVSAQVESLAAQAAADKEV